MTLNELEDVFWRITVACLNLNPDSEDQAVQKRVRISWPSGELGNSDWKRDENVIFLRVTPGMDDYGQLHDVEHSWNSQTGVQTETVYAHRSLRVMWICYGPDSDENAQTLRLGLLRESVRQVLRRNDISISPHIPEPIRIPEPDEAGEWWERCDLTAEVYHLISREYAEEYMQGIPEIRVESGEWRVEI